MRVGYLQFRPFFGEPERNIERILELTQNIDFDLLVMPELSNSGYLFSAKEELKKTAEQVPEGRFCKAITNLSKEKNAYIVCGLAEKSADKFYNSSILAYPNGETKLYRKIHLFNEEKLWFEPGNRPFEVHEITVDGKKIYAGMMICYDWLYPESARTLAMKGAQIICHPSNLVMPYCQDAMYARAIENRVFTITSNRIGTEKNAEKELFFTGQSVILDPKGRYLRRGPSDEEECFIVHIEPAMALNKKMNEHNSIFDDRREEMYK
ncbi:MAG TPA: nitrilase-related carbon-nitrogen hydrolase [Ignavibacteria bacterium]|jgi:predicted amidohydrolase